MFEVAEKIDAASAAINHPIGAVAVALAAVADTIRAGVAAGPAMIAVVVQVDATASAIGCARRAPGPIVVAMPEMTALIGVTSEPAAAAVIVTRLDVDTGLTARDQTCVTVADTAAQAAHLPGAVMIAAAAVLRVTRKIDAGPRTINQTLTAAKAVIVTLAKEATLTGATGLTASGTVGGVRLGIDTGLSALSQTRITSPATTTQAADFASLAIIAAASAIIRIASDIYAGVVTTHLAGAATSVVVVALTENTCLAGYATG